MTDEPKAGSAPVEKAGEVDFEAAYEWARLAEAHDANRYFANIARAYLAIRAEVKQIKTQVVAPLRAQLAEIKAQAEDATEYVLAVENRELRAEVEELKARNADLTRAIEEEASKKFRCENDTLRAEVNRLKQETAQWKHLHDSCHPSQVQLRAELAQARGELDAAEQHVKILRDQLASAREERDDYKRRYEELFEREIGRISR